MRTILSVSVFCALATGALAAGEGNHSHDEDRAYGKPGSADRNSRVVEVLMKEDSNQGMAFEPAQIRLKKGEQVRFIVNNGGTMDHELVVGTLEENLRHAEQMAKNPDMEHDDPNAIRLVPDSSGEILWAFTKAGTFDFSCLLPGHREAGMFGTIIVE